MVKSLRLVIAAISMCFAMSVCASTKEYTEDLVVTINDQSTDPQPATITVERLDNGNINFTLNDFILIQGEDIMPIGNIALTDLSTTEVDGCETFAFSGDLNIQPGSNSITMNGETYPMTDADWMGPILGAIPLDLKGKITDNKLYVTIDITMASLGQVIHVKLGNDFESYTEDLVVTVNDVSTEPQPATIYVETLDNGNINFTLNDFILIQGTDIMPIGNIEVDNLTLTDSEYCKTFSYNDNINIKPGSDSVTLNGQTYPMTEADWMGPMLGAIPLELKGKMTDSNLYVTIDITMAALNQVIHVVLGKDIVDPATGISNVKPVSTEITTYDLTGRRVMKTIKGQVYIQNGKKVIK